MLGIILLILIASYFYRLAEKNRRNKWLFGLLGVATYYVGTILFGFAYGIIYLIQNPDATEDSFNELSVGLLSIPFGLLAAYLLHFFLKRSWKNNPKKEKSSIEEIGSN